MANPIPNNKAGLLNEQAGSTGTALVNAINDRLAPLQDTQAKLTTPTTITSQGQLDAIAETGVYYVAASVLAAPLDQGAYIEHTQTATSTVAYQVARTLDGYDLVRFKNTSWAAWYYTGTKTVDSRLTTILRGDVKKQNPVLCRASRNTGSEAWGVETHVGILGTYLVNQGGFTFGPAINGNGSAIVIPASGWYRVTLNLYAHASQAGYNNRLNVIKNQSSANTVLFVDGAGNVNGLNDVSQSVTTLYSFVKGDVISYYVEASQNLYAYHAFNYTEVSLELIA